MSLHIESTENALAELKKQRTKTLTAAISVSFLGIALMGLLLYLVHIIVAVPEDPPMVAYATQEGDNPDIDLSVTGWNVQALKAAEHGGIKPTKGEIRSTLRKASSYVRKNVMPDGKVFL